MERFLTAFVIVLTSMGMCARQPQKGYRGFLEWSNSLRSELFSETSGEGNTTLNRKTMLFTGFSTSHGYQINKMFFVGGGLCMEKYNVANDWIAPVFIDGRVDFLFGRFSPYGDLRVGYDMARGGLYVSPTVGYRFNWGRKVGVNIGLGLSLCSYWDELFEYIMVAPDAYIINDLGYHNHICPYFSFRLGFDF